MLERYSNRVANSLESDAELNLDLPLNLPAYPPRRDRIRTVPDLRQGLLEVLNLRHCQLIPLIAERNSSLGKVMPPSRQMVYEIQLISRLNHCRQTLRETQTEPELIQQVDALFQVKQDNIEAALWNGLFTSEAMERNFSRSEPPLPLIEDDGFSQTRQAFILFNRIAALNSTIQQQPTWTEPDYLNQLEPHYQALTTLRYGSRWLRSIYLLTHTLNHTANLIEQRLRQRPLCYNQQATPKARIVKNVFNKYYAAELQPYMAKIDRDGRQWLALNQQLLQHFTVIPEPMQRYQRLALSTEAPFWQRYIEARNRHTQAWQRLLKQCNLMPSAS
ncbi:DUF3080 family protein [Amphritea sp. 1_MG-2023]|uniref:DUF3080 family protein n=1 Tax=Amphritea sp. 1_MG-2023 TaxID=3062670 RepID=UPI0026E31836|nr:DUF3080 family protein [Amphritea sp. 1_MG-2023]MDO6563481.1 DUF3080 family protein [Amphritea sp. 1_MG-2023]